MRFSTLSIGLLAFLTPIAAAWSKEDREIFRVRDELTLHEGPEVTFYEFLGISPSASQDEISKAYRKKSRSLHPDKVKQQLAAERVRLAKEAAKTSKTGTKVAKQPTNAEIKAAIKRASDRQARLSIVTNILRGAGRERYDYFMANGFPTWKGTEYYYSRYRPGFGTVITGLFLFAGGAAHYLALYMGWKRQREFVERYIKYARNAAWGENLNIPGVDGQDAPAPAPAAAAAAPAPQRQMYEDGQGRAIPVNRKMRRMQDRDAKKEATKESTGSVKRTTRRTAAATASASASGTATPQPQAQGAGPTGAKKRVVAENGKVLVVDSLGDVYLEQEDEDGKVQEFLLDPNELAKPTIRDTALVRLPLYIYSLTVGRVFNKRAANEDDLDYDDELDRLVDEDEDTSEGSGKRTPSTDSAEDFELLDKSVELDGDKAKTTGASQKQGKAGKRKNKKR